MVSHKDVLWCHILLLMDKIYGNISDNIGTENVMIRVVFTELFARFQIKAWI